MPANQQCRWCRTRIGFGVHNLCKQWYIFRIKEYIDKMENYIIALENLVDELEEDSSLGVLDPQTSKPA
jgi:hypothetical protein